MEVAELVVAARPTAVIAESTTWDAYPELWPLLLDEVWRVARSTDAIAPGRNVMLYRDDTPNVEVGAGGRGLLARALTEPGQRVRLPS